MGTVMMLSHVAAFAVLGAVAAQASSGKGMEPAAAEEQDSFMPRSYEWGDDDVPWGYGHIIHPGRGYYGYPRPYSGVGKYHPRHGQLSPAHADQPSVKLPEHVPGAAVSEMAQPGRYTVVSADGVPLEASEGKKAEPEKAAKDEKKEEVKEEEPAMNATKDEEVHKVNNSEVNRAGEMPGGQPLNETKPSYDSQPAEYHPTPVPSKASSATALERVTANFSAQNSTDETDEAPKQKANDETEAPKVENATEAPKVENATEAPKVNQNANKDPAPEANATSNATSDTISNTTAPVPDENPSPNVTSNASSSDNDNSSRASNASKDTNDSMSAGNAVKSANEKEEQTAGATMGEKDRATKSKEQSNDVSAALASKATNELPKDAPAPKELSSELPTARSQATHAPAKDATMASKPEQATPASTQAQSASHAVDEVKADVRDIKSADKTQSKADDQVTADTSKATDQFKADLSSKIKSMQK